MALGADDIPRDVRARLQAGTAIPAHPLALTSERELDARRQRALTRYYLDAGVGGVAVGVHTTQFAIRDHGLYEPVLRLAAETVEDWSNEPVIRVAGLIGRTDQAVREAQITAGLGYNAGLIGLAAFKGANEDEILEHCRRVAEEIPLFGFYLQPAVGGIPLSRDFWRRFAEIENVMAIKIAPFDRYATRDVVHGVVAARAEERIALYTGNDDHIVADLLTPFTVMRDGAPVTVQIVGGLLGHWCVWTRSAVQQLERIHTAVRQGRADLDLLDLDARVTDCNGAFFDAANGFHGVIAGCHEVLRRQGLLAGRWCLDPSENLSPGQAEEINRVYADHPDLNDDAFVSANLARWLD